VKTLRGFLHDVVGWYEAAPLALTGRDPQGLSFSRSAAGLKSQPPQRSPCNGRDPSLQEKGRIAGLFLGGFASINMRAVA